MDAQVSASVPRAVFSSFMSVRMRASTGKAVIDRAAPMNSATSVAMATSSATTQRLSTTGRGYRERHASARFMPDAMPSLALSDWMSIDMRMATTTTHVSRNP